VQVQRLTRWHFQRVIVSDFLKAVVGTELVSLGTTGLDAKAKDRLLKPVDADRPMMPVEYAVAAFGSDTAWSLAATRSTPPAVAPLFDPNLPDLRCNRPLPAAFEIEWWRFFPVPGGPYQPRNQAQPIDTKLAIPLFNLPCASVCWAD
jgi:hypothetical protein